MNETDIYSEADARAWATHYCALNNGSDVPTMQTWFEGAMDAVRKAEVEPLETEAARYRAALEEIRRRARGIRENGGLCPTGSPYLDGRMWAWQEAGMIANRALHPEDAND